MPCWRTLTSATNHLVLVLVLVLVLALVLPIWAGEDDDFFKNNVTAKMSFELVIVVTGFFLVVDTGGEISSRTSMALILVISCGDLPRIMASDSFFW